MRRLPRRFNGWIQAQPRPASIIVGIGAGLLLFALATVLTHDVVWGMLRGISTAIAIGFALYSVGTWDRGW
jgi:hypothetical protein